MDGREQACWDQLLASTADALRAAIETVQTKGTAAAWKQLQSVFDAVGFPKYPNAPTLNELTAEQRALAELFALRYDVPVVGGYALPTQRWVLRRWLGIDPPSALEREVEYQKDGAPVRGPLWCALKADRANAVIAERLPLIDRIEVFADDAVWAYSMRKDHNDSLLIAKPDLHALRDEGRTWAPRYADELVREPRLRQLAPLDLLFVALARAQVPIEARWDVLLPILLVDTEPELFRECLEAIPFERRAAALAPFLGGGPLRRRTETFGRVVDLHPEPDLVDALFANFKAYSDRPNPADRQALEEVGKRIPKLAASIAKHLERKKVAKLVFEPVPLPARDKLSTLQRKQLKWFEEEGGEWAVLELFVVRDAKGKHVYDATIHAGDDGYVYRVGTATKVATFAQGGAEARSEAVMASLEQGLADYNVGRKRRT